MNRAMVSSHRDGEPVPLSPRRRRGWLSSYAHAAPRLWRGVRPRAALLRLALGVGQRPVTVAFRDGPVLAVRTLLELWVVRATVLEREYLPPGIALGEAATVVDAGASVGDFALTVARERPAGTVHAIEPEPAAFDLLEANCRANRATNVVAHRLALSDRDGFAELACDRRRPVLNTLDPPAGDRRPRLEVPCRRLDGLLAELAVERCDLLKIDCEGAERAILGGLGAAGLARVGAVALEYHADCDRDWLGRLLAGDGFRVWHRPCPVWQQHGLLFASRGRGAS